LTAGTRSVGIGCPLPVPDTRPYKKLKIDPSTTSQPLYQLFMAVMTHWN